MNFRRNLFRKEMLSQNLVLLILKRTNTIRTKIFGRRKISILMNSIKLVFTVGVRNVILLLVRDVTLLLVRKVWTKMNWRISYKLWRKNLKNHGLGGKNWKHWKIDIWRRLRKRNQAGRRKFRGPNQNQKRNKNHRNQVRKKINRLKNRKKIKLQKMINSKLRILLTGEVLVMILMILKTKAMIQRVIQMTMMTMMMIFQMKVMMATMKVTILLLVVMMIVMMIFLNSRCRIVISNQKLMRVRNQKNPNQIQKRMQKLLRLRALTNPSERPMKS